MKTEWFIGKPDKGGTYLVTIKTSRGQTEVREADYAPDHLYISGTKYLNFTWYRDCNRVTDRGDVVLAWTRMPEPYVQKGIHSESTV